MSNTYRQVMRPFLMENGKYDMDRAYPYRRHNEPPVPPTFLVNDLVFNESTLSSGGYGRVMSVSVSNQSTWLYRIDPVDGYVYTADDRNLRHVTADEDGSIEHDRTYSNNGVTNGFIESDAYKWAVDHNRQFDRDRVQACIDHVAQFVNLPHQSDSHDYAMVLCGYGAEIEFTGDYNLQGGRRFVAYSEPVRTDRTSILANAGWILALEILNGGE